MPPKENVSSDPISQIASTLKSASNVLITVSANPSVDQLAACIGLTLAVNKMGKHGTAVYSGRTPSTIEFLKPEETLERNTDSLRDFIISLDKSKADKLRYKVEDSVVKIFITPYRTSISDRDLEFTQGDFNVDAVIALGVHEKTDFDDAIVAHGRILHDATIVSINTSTRSDIGSIDWIDSKASSLCEMVSDLVFKIDEKLLDSQMSTALLTGMVAETDRFGNERATPHTMSVSGTLMASGASPQLIASKLEVSEERPAEIPRVEDKDEYQDQPPNPDGMIEIDHTKDSLPEPTPKEPEEVPKDEIHIDEHGKFRKARELLGNKFKEPRESNQPRPTSVTPGMVLEPPRFGGQLTAASIPEEDQYPPSPDPFIHQANQNPEYPHSERPPTPQAAQPDEAPRRDEPQRRESRTSQPTPPPPPPPMPTKPPLSQPFVDVIDHQTLTQIEEAVDSPHVNYVDYPTSRSNMPQTQATPAAPDTSLDELSRIARQVAEDVDSHPYALEATGATGALIPDHSNEQPVPPPQIIPDHYTPPLDDPGPPPNNSPPPGPPPFVLPPAQ